MAVRTHFERTDIPPPPARTCCNDGGVCCCNTTWIAIALILGAIAITLLLAGAAIFLSPLTYPILDIVEGSYGILALSIPASLCLMSTAGSLLAAPFVWAGANLGAFSWNILAGLYSKDYHIE